MAVYVCQQLFEGRLHPYGERPGVDDNSRALPFFEPQSAQVESALRHGAHSFNFRQRCMTGEISLRSLKAYCRLRVSYPLLPPVACAVGGANALPVHVLVTQARS